MALTFRDIGYFLAVAKSGLLASAAAQCEVSQPALTKAIRRVETEFGLELFERSARGMKLTAAGLRFLEQAQRMYVEYSDTVLLADEMRAQRAGLIRIGATDTTARNRVMPALASLLRKRPALRVRIRFGRSDTLMREVISGDLDAAVVPVYEGQSPDCDLVSIETESVLPVVRIGHPLARKAHVSLHELVPYGWILAGHKSLAFERVAAVFAHARLPQPRVAVEIPYTSEATLALSAATDLISLVPSSFLRHFGKERLKTLPVVELEVPRSIALLTRRGPSSSPLIEALKQALSK